MRGAAEAARAYGAGPGAGAREFCCVCLKRRAEAALRRASPPAAALLAALQLRPMSSWVCCWCSAKLRVFSDLKNRALRSHCWLERLTTQMNSSCQEDESLLPELAEIKKENYQLQPVHTSDSNSSSEVIEVKIEEYQNTTNISEKVELKKTHDSDTNDIEINSIPFNDENDESYRSNWDAVYSKTSEEALKHITLVHLTEDDYRKEHAISLTMKRYVNCQFKCQKCAMGHRFKDLHETHMKLHDLSSGTHHCHICDQYIKSHRALSKHISQHFRRYRCELCGRMETTKTRVINHYMGKHSQVEFRCQWCGKSFEKRPTYLKCHIDRVHLKNRNYQCSLCSKTFWEQSALKHHSRVHKPSNTAQHECPTCKKSFTSAQSMSTHQREHVHSAPGLCVLCLRMFTSNYLLRRHTRIKHSDTGHSFKCHDCGKSYGVKSHLRDHIVWKHTTLAGYDCTQCPKKFRQKSVLQRHVKYVHDKTAPVKNKLCDLCGAGFSTRSLLDQHRLIHTGERPHSCSECGQTFRQKSAMQTHVKLKHRKPKGTTGDRTWVDGT